MSMPRDVRRIMELTSARLQLWKARLLLRLSVEIQRLAYYCQQAVRLSVTSARSSINPAAAVK